MKGHAARLAASDGRGPAAVDEWLESIPLLAGRRGLRFSPVARIQLKLWILNGRVATPNTSEVPDTIEAQGTTEVDDAEREH